MGGTHRNSHRTTGQGAVAPKTPGRQPPREPAHHPLLNLQHAAGNRAVSAAVQRDQTDPKTRTDPKDTKDAKDFTLSMAMFRAAYPGIMNALDYQHAKLWYDIIVGWQANREVDRQLTDLDQRAKANAWDPRSGGWRFTDAYQEKAAAIEAHRKFVDEGSSRAPLDPAKIIKVDEIMAPQPWNVDAQYRFRAWLVDYLKSGAMEAELSTRRELVSQWERTEHPELEGGFHANLLWSGQRRWNTGGYLGWDDAMHLPGVSDKYEADVTNGPHIVAMRQAIEELATHIAAMMDEHQNRSDRNAEHGIVRHVSEALGGPGAMELAILRLRVQQNPEDTDAKAELAEKEAEAGSYPKMKGPDGIWFEPQQTLAAARKFMQGGQIELAAAAVAECQKSTSIATARFAGYERRVMGGAGIAVKWLERAKTAGKIASAFTGAGGIVRASITAAGYTFAQEGSQQVVAHWIDPNNKIDLAGLAQQAAIDGLATLFGGLTQGAFVNALTTRFGARMVASGLSEATTKTVLSAAGATAASFYNVPAKIVLDKVIAGKAMPHSLSDVCDMVVTEAVQGGAMDLVGSYVHASAAKHDAAGADQTPSGPEMAAPKEIVDALAGPEAVHPETAGPDAAGKATTQSPAPMIGKGVPGPATVSVSAEARAMAIKLAPVHEAWKTLSPASRPQRLIDAVWAELAGTGMPKPTAIFKPSEGGLFRKELWVTEIEGSLMQKAELTPDEFATACEYARHEMEHALQMFRIARREGRLHGEDATALANRLQIPKSVAEAAIEANTGHRQAEKLEGTQADADAAAHYESIYGAGNPHREKTLTDLPVAIKELNEAADRVLQAKGKEKIAEALDLQIQANQTYRKTIDDYLALPEEIPAFEAGRGVKKAVAEHLAALAKAKEDVRTAVAEVDRVRSRVTAETADTERMSALNRAALRRAFATLQTRLDRVRDLQTGLTAAKGKK